MEMRKLNDNLDGGIESFFTVIDKVSFYGGLLACVVAILFIILPALHQIVFHCP